MTHEQQALWQRIRDFRIDAADASFPYSARLARENGWTPAHAARVVEEYRRFAFLAVAAGHGVTPSKAVDEAWHLHLIYTRNYWEGFCAVALGRPLHHHPADGNAADDRKYEGWYEATLASYERLFSEPPPADLWPRTEAPARKARRFLPWLALSPLLLAGCDEPANPLDWHGPPFLQLIFVVYLAFLAGALALRWAMRGPVDGPSAEEWRLHPYEQAYLNGGGRLALVTAIARLEAAGALGIEPKTRRVTTIDEGAGEGALDRAILRAASGTTGATFETVQRTTKPVLDEIETSLRRQGLLCGLEATMGTVLGPLLLVGLPILLGGAKILVGMDRHRPVGFLVVGCIVATVLNLILFQPARRSRYGDAVLERLRTLGMASRTALGRAGTPPLDLALGIALFGLPVLAGGPYRHLSVLATPVSSGGADGGSGCGGSSCGGGGGCGGGGCGGCGS